MPTTIISNNYVIQRNVYETLMSAAEELSMNDAHSLQILQLMADAKKANPFELEPYAFTLDVIIPALDKSFFIKRGYTVQFAIEECSKAIELQHYMKREFGIKIDKVYYFEFLSTRIYLHRRICNHKAAKLDMIEIVSNFPLQARSYITNLIYALIIDHEYEAAIHWAARFEKEFAHLPDAPIAPTLPSNVTSSTTATTPTSTTTAVVTTLPSPSNTTITPSPSQSYNRGDADLWLFDNNRAWALLQVDRLEEAMLYVNKSIKKAPNKPSSLDTRAAIYLAMGNAEAALKDVTNAIAINTVQNRNIRGVYMTNLASIRLSLNQHDKAFKLICAAITNYQKSYRKSDIDKWHRELEKIGWRESTNKLFPSKCKQQVRTLLLISHLHSFSKANKDNKDGDLYASNNNKSSFLPLYSLMLMPMELMILIFKQLGRLYFNSLVLHYSNHANQLIASNNINQFFEQFIY